MSYEQNLKEHYIITNSKLTKIWLKPFVTYQDAKAEYDFQVQDLKPGQIHDWRIEKRTTLF